MFGFLALIIVLTALVALGVVVSASVIPRLSQERRDSRSLLAWSDLWLPLILALPWPVVMLSSGVQLDETYAIWFAAAPAVIVAALGLALSPIGPEQSGGERQDGSGGFRLGITRRDGLMLVGLGAILLVASASDGLDARQGQILVTAGVVWLWICAASRPARVGAEAGVRFLVDWTEPLQRPIPARAKLTIVASLVALTAALFTFRGIRLEFTAPLVAMTQLAVFMAAAALVGSGFAQRMIGGTLILGIAFGLGAAALTRLGATLPLWYGDNALAPIRPTHILGVSALRSTSILLMAIGVIGLLRYRLTESISTVFTSAILFFAAAVVLISGSEATLMLVGEAIGTALSALIEAASPNDGA